MCRWQLHLLELLHQLFVAFALFLRHFGLNGISKVVCLQFGHLKRREENNQINAMG